MSLNFYFPWMGTLWGVITNERQLVRLHKRVLGNLTILKVVSLRVISVGTNRYLLHQFSKCPQLLSAIDWIELFWRDITAAISVAQNSEPAFILCSHNSPVLITLPMQTLPFVPKHLHGLWPHEWKPSVELRKENATALFARLSSWLEKTKVK